AAGPLRRDVVRRGRHPRQPSRAQRQQRRRRQYERRRVPGRGDVEAPQAQRRHRGARRRRQQQRGGADPRGQRRRGGWRGRGLGGLWRRRVRARQRRGLCGRRRRRRRRGGRGRPDEPGGGADRPDHAGAGAEAGDFAVRARDGVRQLGALSDVPAGGQPAQHLPAYQEAAVEARPRRAHARQHRAVPRPDCQHV
ncbi:hypothetical protein LPJ61_006671, partial [Coemansia biformis]